MVAHPPRDVPISVEPSKQAAGFHGPYGSHAIQKLEEECVYILLSPSFSSFVLCLYYCSWLYDSTAMNILL